MEAFNVISSALDRFFVLCTKLFDFFEFAWVVIPMFMIYTIVRVLLKPIVGGGVGSDYSRKSKNNKENSKHE